MTWHISDQLARSYVSGNITDADAWSAEAHLVGCKKCQAVVGIASSGTEIEALVADTWASTIDNLTAPGRVRPGTERCRLYALLAAGPAARGAWLLATALVLGIAVGLDWAGQGPIHSVPMLAVFAPLLPVVGVALTYGSGLDGSREIIAATPDGGLRLLLLRTIAVLAFTTPLALLADVVAGPRSPGSAVTWLLPSLVLTALTLALGSVTGLVRAAIAVGSMWLVVFVGPILTRQPPLVVSVDARPVLVLVGLAAAAVVVLRRRSFETMSFRLES
jgi:hypothetical protein